MSSAALRIPDARFGQVVPLLLIPPSGPQILIHEGARQTLERRLEAASDGPVQLAITDNRRRMVTHTKVRGTLRVRVHMMFLGAPERIKQALVEYVVHADRHASQLLGSFIHENTHNIRASRPVTGPLKTRGRAHDLTEVLDAINAKYFGSAVTDVLITWGRRTSAANGKRGAIKLGSYSAAERLIRVHPVLDRDWVPRYFLGYIVYHELLHHLIPQVKVSGRAVLHTPEFTHQEREYQQYERAIAWEQKHIDRLLRGR
jgi:predicted metal-dependent hydrolase